MAERREAYNPLLKSYPDSDKVNAVSEGAEVLYLRLLAQSDDAGRYYGEASWILAKLFTARMIAKELTHSDINQRLSELENVGLLHRYQAAGGTYLELLGVFKTLRSDVKPKYLFPQPLTAHVTDAGRIRNDDGPLEPDPEQDQEQEQEPYSAGGAGGEISASEFLEAWNTASGNVKARAISGRRAKALKSRLREPGWREHWLSALAKFPLKCFSDQDGWKPEIDWFLRPDTVTKILEGKYDWSKTNGRSGTTPGAGQRYRGD